MIFITVHILQQACSEYTSVCESIWILTIVKVNDALRQEKLQYLQAKVVYEELKDILLDYEISRLDHEVDGPSAQVKLGSCWTLCKT